MSLSKLAALRAKSNQVNSAYGSDIVRTSVVTNIPRIPTGSLAFDYACGVNAAGIGGWAVGHGNCIVGWESSGKTTSLLKACGNLQHMCVRCYRPCVDFKLERLTDEDGNLVMSDTTVFKDGEHKPVPFYTVKGRCSCYKEGLWAPDPPEFKGSVKEKKAQKAAHAEYLKGLLENSFEAATIVYADTENTLDLRWGKKNGLNAFVWDEEYQANCPVAEFQHIVPSYAEQCIDVVDEYVKSGVVDAVVVDSIPAMVPMTETQESAEDWQRGLQARLINKAFRRWTSSAAEVRSRPRGARLVTMFYVQQWRATMSQFGGNTMPGGNGQRFAFSIINEVYTSDKEIKADAAAHFGSTTGDGKAKGKDAVESAYAIRINVKNRKNKTWPPLKTASFRMALMDDGELKAGEVIEVDYIFKMAMNLDIITKEGSSKYKFRGKEYSAQSHIMKEIATSKSAYDWTVNKVRSHLYAATEGSH